MCDGLFGNHAPDAEPQDRHQQQRRLLHRQHRQQLRLARRRLRRRASGSSRTTSPTSRAALVPGQRPARPAARSAPRTARGACRKDEFPETGGWPHQLYVREARRMVADYVMTEHDCRGTARRRGLRRPGRLHDGLAQLPARGGRRATRATRATCRSAASGALPDLLPRDRAAARASARTCSCRSACRPRTSPTARSGWSRCSWSLGPGGGDRGAAGDRRGRGGAGRRLPGAAPAAAARRRGARVAAPVAGLSQPAPAGSVPSSTAGPGWRALASVSRVIRTFS